MPALLKAFQTLLFGLIAILFVAALLSGCAVSSAAAPPVDCQPIVSESASYPDHACNARECFQLFTCDRAPSPNELAEGVTCKPYVGANSYRCTWAAQ